jgi:hypothetical protein
MSGKQNRDRLVQMFPRELGTCDSISETSTPSYNDGGNRVTTIWRCRKSGHLYRTIYNDWSVGHPDTTCKSVKRREETVVYYDEI